MKKAMAIRKSKELSTILGRAEDVNLCRSSLNLRTSPMLMYTYAIKPMEEPCFIVKFIIFCLSTFDFPRLYGIFSLLHPTPITHGHFSPPPFPLYYSSNACLSTCRLLLLRLSFSRLWTISPVRRQVLLKRGKVYWEALCMKCLGMKTHLDG